MTTQFAQQLTEPAVTAQRVLVATSPGIRQIKHIASFLSVDAVVAPTAVSDASDVAGVVVWGRKDSAATGLKFAAANGLDVSYLEDGWVRTASAKAHNRSSYSLLVDERGVYYDASCESTIENVLNLPGNAFSKEISAKQLQYAKDCRAQLVAADITKYNYCRSASLPKDDKPIVLVVDQTLDDASVRLGCMDSTRFADMLHCAVDENPNATVVVRTHPDVVAGRRRGYLTELANELNVSISASGDNPIPWLKRADRVYAATSQLGYEALLCNTPVSVFGQPFYAGWGLTDDRQPIAKRSASRTVDELFHVAHIALARYVNPIDGERWQLHECLEHVQLQKKWFAKNAKNFHCVGITPWKRRYIRQYLRSPDGSVSFKEVEPVNSSQDDGIDLDANATANASCKATAKGAQESNATTTYATWSFRQFKAGGPRTSAGVMQPLMRIEDGFLRSAGLGSDFTAPGSLVVDSRGLYFDPSQASDLEHWLNSKDCTPADIQRAARLRKRILNAKLSKYNVGHITQQFATCAANTLVLVVGQVEDDASIQRGCDTVADNKALLQAVREARPDAYIVYKPHPDVLAGNRAGVVHDPLQWADEVNNHSSIAAGLEWCDELHTMTSLAGFEALLRGKSVFTYGLPFYAGWGLTQDIRSCGRRTRRRTLDELVYMTLIEYPRYVDIDSGEFITPETMVARLEKQQSTVNASHPWMHRQMAKVVNIVKGCRYAP